MFLQQNKPLKNGVSIIAIKHLAKSNIKIEYLPVNSILRFTKNSEFIFSKTSAAICDTEKKQNRKWNSGEEKLNKDIIKINLKLNHI